MSTRSEAKKARHERYLDQVALDKLQGLETGHIAHAAYRRPGKWKPETRQKRKGKPRPGQTYRAAKRIAERGPRRSLQLKAERLASGETRSQADNRRRLEALAA